MSELNIKIRKLQDNGSTFRATPESLYMGGVGSAKVDTLCFDVPEEWKGCAITLHVQRLSGTLPDPQLLDEKNRAVVDQRWTKEKQGLWMLMAVGADGYTAMTKPGRYTCYETIDRDSTTEAITPSVYEQFVALVKKETAEANRAAKNAAASAEIAKNFESTITATGEQVQREITATADQTKQAIEEKAKAAMASIPEDYTALSESVGQLKEDLWNTEKSIVLESDTILFDSAKNPSDMITNINIKNGDVLYLYAESDVSEPLVDGGIQVQLNGIYFALLINRNLNKWIKLTANRDANKIGLNLTDYSYLAQKTNIKLYLIYGSKNELYNLVHSDYTKCIAFPSESEALKFRTDENNQIKVLVKNKIHYFHPKNENAIWAVTIAKGEYTVPNLSFFVINASKNIVEIKTEQEIVDSKDNLLICFLNHYGNVKGEWYKYWSECNTRKETGFYKKSSETYLFDSAKTIYYAIDNLNLQKGTTIDIMLESDVSEPIVDGGIQLSANNTFYLVYNSNRSLNIWKKITLTKDVSSFGLVLTNYNYLRQPTNFTLHIRYGIYGEVARTTEIVRTMPYANLNDYYKNGYIDEKIKEINEQTAVINGLSFPFVTDLHFFDNALQSKFIIKELLDNTSMSFSLCGGDFVQAYGNKAECDYALEKLREYYKTIGKNRFFTVRGNHDFTVRESSNSSNGYTAPIGYSYDAMIRPSEYDQSSIQAGKFYYYIDIPSQKTRIYMLSSCDTQKQLSDYWGVEYNVSEEQINWLLEKVQEHDNWHYIFVSHISADPDVSGYDISQKPLHDIMLAIANKTAYKNVNFANSNNEVVCHIVGHNHIDASHMDNNVLTISTTSDACYQDDGYQRSKGNITEQAIDVFTFNYDEKEIYAKRIGGGNDRKWKY